MKENSRKPDSENPQNPYISCIVQASAGSGKTYQLSRRFLYLVAAGAEPSEVLTITFTKKAAQEMRQRIIREASDILKNPARAQEFDQEIKVFYENHMSSASDTTSPPKTAIDTAHEILSQTQSLKVSTIDSLFNEWVSRFTYEASDGQFPSPYSLCSQEEEAALENASWSLLFKILNGSAGDDEAYNNIRNILKLTFEIIEPTASTLKVSTLKKVVEDLAKNESIVWQAKRAGNPLFTYRKTNEGFENDQQVIDAIKGDLNTIISSTKSPDKFSDVFEVTEVENFASTALFTQKFEISKSLIRGKKRETLINEISRIENAVSERLDSKAIEVLTALAQAFLSLFSVYVKLSDDLKHSKGLLSFNEVTRGAFHLLTNTASSGAAWVIQKRVSHLLLDEFQDTSLLQWEIFFNLTRELVSKKDEKLNFPNTVFIVGDVKQSIYGFRQADPSVMQSAKTFLISNGHHEIPLNKSYRTANVILEYVNTVFKELMGLDFPLHSTAEINDQPFVPDAGKIIVFDQFEDSASEDTETKAVENEAEALSDFIRYVLDNPNEYPVHEGGTFRAIKPSDIAILYKNKTKSESFEKALRARGLNSIKEEQNGFFDRQEVSDLIALLKYCAYRSDHLSLLQVIKSPIIGLSDQEALSYFVHNRHKVKAETEQETPRPTIENLIEYIRTDNSKKTSKSISRLIDFSKALNIHNSKSVRSLIFQLNKTLNIAASYQHAYGGTEGTLAHNNIFKFMQLVLSLENDGHTSLFAIIEKLTSLKDSDLEGNAPSSDDAIKLMTIHKSKGLEFPMVFIVETAQNWFKKNHYWEPLKDDNKQSKLAFFGHAGTKNLISSSLNAVKDKVDDHLYSEAIRVLYVAMTRASQYLVISGNTKDAEKRLASEKDRSFYNCLLSSVTKMGETKKEAGRTTFERKIATELTDSKHIVNISKWNINTEVETTSEDLEIISPHDEIVKAEVSIAAHKSPPADLSADLGSFFHKIIDRSIKNKQFISEKACRYLRETFFPKQGNNAELVRWCIAYEEDAKFAYDQLLKPILNSATRIYSEVKLLHRNEKSLTKGICDLVVEYDDKILLIDHKTTGPLNSEEMLDFCLQKSYDKQLERYQEVLIKIFPEKKVYPAVLLSRSRDLVYLPI